MHSSIAKASHEARYAIRMPRRARMNLVLLSKMVCFHANINHKIYFYAYAHFKQ
jgi:hypothetical protein